MCIVRCIVRLFGVFALTIFPEYQCTFCFYSYQCIICSGCGEHDYLTVNLYCTAQLTPPPVPSGDGCEDFEVDNDDGVCYQVTKIDQFEKRTSRRSLQNWLYKYIKIKRFFKKWILGFSYYHHQMEICSAAMPKRRGKSSIHP